VESSAGVGRIMLAALSEAYREEESTDEMRLVLDLPYQLAPIKIAVFPLLKNKPDLVAKAKEVYNELKLHYSCEFDDNGNVGKRYSRQDEIGTPYCLTIDFDSLENNDLTVRQRGDRRGGQELPRLKISELKEFFADKF
jgi:glycyl-tRNA synthetase